MSSRYTQLKRLELDLYEYDSRLQAARRDVEHWKNAYDQAEEKYSRLLDEVGYWEKGWTHAQMEHELRKEES